MVLMLTNHCFAFPVCLPLYVEEWSEAVLERLLTLIGGMDSGLGHR